MKKIGSYLLLTLLAASSAACNDDEGDYATTMTIATVRALGTDFYFATDNGKTLYPGDKSRIGGFQPLEGKRAAFTFRFLDQPVEGFDYNIAVYAIDDAVLTGGTATVTTQEELDRFGDGNLLLAPNTLLLTTRTHMNIVIQYEADDESKHAFTLVRNDIPDAKPDKTEKGYYNLSLCHKTSGDKGRRFTRWLSIDLKSFEDELASMEGVIISYETPMGTEHFQYKLPEPF